RAGGVPGDARLGRRRRLAPLGRRRQGRRCGGARPRQLRAAAAVAGMLRVLPLNIWNLSGHWRSRREAIVSVVRRWTPDVVCLQEVVANERGNQAEWLASELGDWAVAYARAAVGAGAPCRADGVRRR